MNGASIKLWLSKINEVLEMKIGVISDTHGYHERVKLAVKNFSPTRI